MMSKNDIEELHSELEKLGEQQVKINFTQGCYGGSKKKVVEAWIQSKERGQDLIHKTDELNLAKESNDIAKRANCISVISIAISILAIVISICMNL